MFAPVQAGPPALSPVRDSKAVTSIEPWSRGPTLDSVSEDADKKAARYLKAYKVGWFHKAGRKITNDLATLPWTVSDGDAESGDREAVLDRPDLDIPFATLSPIDQFQRLMERPNPNQTGRVLRQKTQIRIDFGGAAFWYLENAGSGLPTAIYGISPARMWPARAKDGSLLGWILDRNSPSGGVPFDKDEIVVFSAATSDDDDWFGVSVVEAVWSQVPLTDQIARHTSDVLTTGGRLAGMAWPKNRALDEAEYVDAQRAWRSVSSDANAARRLLLFPEPMEYAAGASTPAEIGIPELATLNRDEILTAFPLSPYMLGVPTPGGLNSGEVRREDRRDYWEGTIHPRADLMQEVIQTEVLSRYEEKVGQTFNFQIEEPNLDDAPVLLEKAAAFQSLVSIGLDPVEALKAVELDHIKFLGLPELLDPAKQAQMAKEAAAAENQKKEQAGGTTTLVNDSTRRDNTQTQATLGKAIKAREDVSRHAALLLTDFLDGQRERVVDRLRAALPASKADRKAWIKADPEWWNGTVEDAELANVLRVVYEDSARGGLQNVADTLGRIVPNKAVARITDDLLTYGGERITDINARTLQAISIELAEGTKRGYSIAQLIDGVPAEEFRGVLNVGLDNGVGVWGDARAETIARTETALSYNRAALGGYREFNVRQVQAIDGDKDAECATRNGQTFSLDDAYGIADHPNGTLDWVPVVGDKAAHMETDDVTPAEVRAIVAEMLVRASPPTPPAAPQPIIVKTGPDDGLRALAEEMKEAIASLPAPVVNVPETVVNVPETVVNVAAPVVNVPAPIVNVAPPDMTVMEAAVLKSTTRVQDVRIVESTLPPRKRKVKRDLYGRVTEMTEE
jgi:phage portal protein BeeE